MKSKKLVGILVVLLGILLLPKEALADVIWTPQDSFFEEHYEECEYLSRVYTVNGPKESEGSAILYESPESSTEIAVMEKGATMYISFTYKDGNGIEWGVYEDSEENKTGWIPMAYLEVVYDYISFEEEFGSQFVEKNGELDSSYIEKEIYFWDYPGSTSGMTCELRDVLAYSAVYEDGEGREWGYVSYYYGIKHKWFCIDDPTADFETLYPDEAPQRGDDVSENNENSEKIVPDTSKKDNMIIIVTMIVSVVVVITILLLVYLRKGKAKR